MKIFSSLLEALGLLAIVGGATWVDVRLGVIVCGVVLVLLGLTLDPPRRSR